MLKPTHHVNRLRRQQRGFSLIEVLVALLVFSFGVLALVGLQTTALRLAADARDRSTATFMADQLIGLMLISDRRTAPVLSFQHRTTVGPSPCSPEGADTTNPAALAWLAMLGDRLPGADAAAQQITVINSGTAPDNVTDVTVTLCWRRPGEDGFSRLTVANRVPWP